MLAAQYFDPAPAASELLQPMPPPKKGARPPHGRERPPSGRERPPPGARQPGPPRHIFQIYYGLQNVPAESLEQWILDQEDQESMEIRLVDTDGKEIYGRDLLPGSEVVLNKLSGFRRRATHRQNNVLLFGQELYRPEWGQLFMIIAERPPDSAIISFLKERLWLRLALALLISGLISYAVSRYLTRSLKHLQLASRSLAEGDLDTRISVPDRGGDETDELARDFNSMAGQLQEKIQAQKRLLSDVSHELRSPLARMRVALALAEKDPQRSEEQLVRIEKEAERLDELISQLLSVPDGPVDFEDSIDLVTLLESLCGDADYEARSTEKSVQFLCEMAELVIRSQGDLLKKAFENVIRNALKHTPKDCPVDVRLERLQNEIQVEIRDQGPGVDDVDLARIFEPFYRTDLSRQRETGGVGLGLSIASRAIKRHGGTITAQNTTPGLCIQISLPVH